MIASIIALAAAMAASSYAGPDIRLSVDVTDTTHRVVSVHERLKEVIPIGSGGLNGQFNPASEQAKCVLHLVDLCCMAEIQDAVHLGHMYA